MAKWLCVLLCQVVLGTITDICHRGYGGILINFSCRDAHTGAAGCDGWAGLASTAPWNMWNTPRNPYGTGYVWLKGNLVARRNLQVSACGHLPVCP